MNDDCIFCKIINSELPCCLVEENNLAMAFMTISPATSGHMLVIPKEHGSSIVDISEESSSAVMSLAKKCAKALMASEIKSEGFNFHISNGKSAGQEVFHSHLHIIPRFKGDKVKLQASYASPSIEKLNEIAKEIKKNI